MQALALALTARVFARPFHHNSSLKETPWFLDPLVSQPAHRNLVRVSATLKVPVPCARARRRAARPGAAGMPPAPIALAETSAGGLPLFFLTVY